MKKKGYKIATAKQRKELWDKDNSVEFSLAFSPGTVMVNKEGEFASWMMELPKHCCC